MAALGVYACGEVKISPSIEYVYVSYGAAAAESCIANPARRTKQKINVNIFDILFKISSSYLNLSYRT